MMKQLCAYLTVVLVAVPMMALASETNGTIDASYRYAWSDKIGVIDMTNVKVTDAGLSGTANSAQMGIISFDDPTFKVTNDGKGNLKGSAYGTASGLINFSGVTIDNLGYFVGVANGGFLSGNVYFDCTNNSNCPNASSARVRTDWRPTTVRTTSTVVTPPVVVAPTPVVVTAPTVVNKAKNKDYLACESLNDFVSYSRCVADIDKKRSETTEMVTTEAKAVDGDYSISINDGKVTTNSLDVVISLKAPEEAVNMIVSKDNNFGFLSREKFSATKNWKIEDNEAVPQFIYVKFYNASGQPLKVVASSITLDKRQGDAVAEANAKIAFKIMYAREPKADSLLDAEALKIMAYGLPKNIARDLVMEKAAIAQFVKYYKHLPAVDEEWNIVKGYAYAGAVLAKLNPDAVKPEAGTEPVTETPATTEKDCSLKVKLTKNMDVGATGAEVTILQTALKCLGLLASDYKESGKFDSATESAVMAFQKEHKLICNNGSYCGFVGKGTRAKLNAIKSVTVTEIKAEDKTVATDKKATNPFTRNLTVNMEGNDVTKLQQYLATDGDIYPEAKVTGMFGPATESAVKRFQKKYDLKCSDGTYCGYVGPATRKKLNELYTE